MIAKIKRLKKITALLLALVCVMISEGSSVNTALAANMTTGTHIFQSPGIDVFGDGRQATYTVKFADGVNAYCIEYAADIKDLSSYTPMDNPYVNLKPEQRKQIAYALAYGYSPSSPTINSSVNISKYVMTQTMIWCITEKYWGDEIKMNKVRDRMASAVSCVYTDVSVRCSQDYFNQLWSDMSLAMDKVVPGFTSNDKEINVLPITLNWNSKNNRYETTLTESSEVISSFDFSGLNSAGIGCNISGSNITFYTNKAISGISPVITLNPKDGTYAARHCVMSAIYWGNSIYDQTVVSLTNIMPDPIKAYARFATETSTIRIHKVSSENGEGLNNVTFDVYEDAECTSLVKSVVTERLDGENGMADAAGLNVGMTYYIKERAGAGAENHRHLSDAVAVTVKSNDNVIKILNDRVPVTINLTKTDEKNGKGIAGAVYSLYAREDIKAAGDKIIYTAGSWVADFPETDEKGRAVLNNLHIGRYYVKEKSAPVSGEYILDSAEHEADAYVLSKDFASDAVISVNVNVTEKRSPGYIKIEKTDSETGKLLAGAVFGIYSDKNCTNIIQTLTTDISGTATSKALDEGTYYIKEIKTPAGYVSGTPVYSKTVTAAKTSVIKIENRPVTVTVSKRASAGECTEIPGAKLVIKDSEGNEIDRWISSPEPHVIKALPAGKYTLTELEAPFGYQLAETVEFTVEETGENQNVEMIDAETYGKVIINKTDEKTEKPIEGVTFEIRVAEDVFDSDGNIVIKAGTIADVIETDKKGKAESELLPIGIYGADGWIDYIKYDLQETKAPDGYILDDMVYGIQFDYVDDKTPVIIREYNIDNELEETEQETTVTATKDTPVPNTGDCSTGAVWWIIILLFSVLLLFTIISLKLKDV